MDSDRTIIAGANTVWYLVDGSGRRHIIDKESVAGREAGCDLILEEGRCSRKHARLLPGIDGLQVTDLGSSNGTFVNDNRVQEAVVRNGDLLRFDTMKFVVEQEGAGADATLIAPLTPPPVPAAAPVVPAVSPQPPAVSAPAAPPAPVAVASVLPASAPAPAAATSAPDPAPAAKEPTAAKPAPKAAEPAPEAKGAWWAPKDEGPEGTMLMSASAVLEAAPVEGTMVMAALGSADPVLVGLSGSAKGRSFPLKGDRWKIGRDGNECDVQLEDGGVSAFHAQIIHEGETWKLVNLMSSNGSFVNGQRIQTAYLNSGDRLRFGGTELIFNLGGMTSLPPASGGASSTASVTASAKASGGIPGWVYAVIGFALVAGVGAWLLL